MNVGSVVAVRRVRVSQASGGGRRSPDTPLLPFEFLKQSATRTGRQIRTALRTNGRAWRHEDRRSRRRVVKNLQRRAAGTWRNLSYADADAGANLRAQRRNGVAIGMDRHGRRCEIEERRVSGFQPDAARCQDVALSVQELQFGPTGPRRDRRRTRR